MDNVASGNKIPGIICEHLCIGGGDHYCGEIDGVAVYSIGMYITTLVAIAIFFYFSVLYVVCTQCCQFLWSVHSLGFL